MGCTMTRKPSVPLIRGELPEFELHELQLVLHAEYDVLRVASEVEHDSMQWQKPVLHLFEKEYSCGSVLLV